MGAGAILDSSTPVITEEIEESSSTARKIAVFTAMTASGIAGRVALQHVPSVEPIVAIAVALGFYSSARYGASSGASAFYVSNFLVWGGQGPWTLFQVLGAGAAGATGGVFSKLSSSKASFFGSMVAGTLVYELAVNVGSVTYGIGALNPAYLLAAVPFGLIHLASTISFGSIIYGFEEQIRL